MLRNWLLPMLATWSLRVWADQPVPTDPAAVQEQLQTYYFDAARQGDGPMLETFIEAGYSLNTQDEKGYTALILAAYHGHGAAVERLLAAGADACIQDNRGNTALMGAIFKGQVQIDRKSTRLNSSH